MSEYDEGLEKCCFCKGYFRNSQGTIYTDPCSNFVNFYCYDCEDIFDDQLIPIARKSVSQKWTKKRKDKKKDASIKPQ